MATTPKVGSERVLQGALVNYLVSQARTVESSVNRALWALLERDQRIASEVFLTEPRINEMEITIDEHAIRLLQRGSLSDADVRLIVASLKINNDLERIGDLAVNLCERTISLAAIRATVQAPGRTRTDDRRRARHGFQMPGRTHLSECRSRHAGGSWRVTMRSIGIVIASLKALLGGMASGFVTGRAQSAVCSCTSRNLERIADHATNIAEDILFWVRGLEVRHGRHRLPELAESSRIAVGQ